MHVTVWGDDERFVKTYFRTFPNRLTYSELRWGIRQVLLILAAPTT